MTTYRAITAATLILAAHALAQPGPPPLPPSQPAPSVQPAPPSPAPVAPLEKPYQIGPRLGGSLGLGAWAPGPMISFVPFDLHGGVQVSPLFAAYLRLGFSLAAGLGIKVDSMGASVQPSGAGMWVFGANAELGLGDTFFIAAGPQVGVGTWIRARVDGNASGAGVQAIYSAGAHPGADVRLGVALGQPNKLTKRRTQFTIAFDLSLLYASNVYEGAVSAGTQGVSIAIAFSEALAVVPTLQIGFEWR